MTDGRLYEANYKRAACATEIFKALCAKNPRVATSILVREAMEIALCFEGCPGILDDDNG